MEEETATMTALDSEEFKTFVTKLQEKSDADTREFIDQVVDQLASDLKNDSNTGSERLVDNAATFKQIVIGLSEANKSWPVIRAYGGGTGFLFAIPEGRTTSDEMEKFAQAVKTIERYGFHFSVGRSGSHYTYFNIELGDWD